MSGNSLCHGLEAPAKDRPRHNTPQTTSYKQFSCARATARHGASAWEPATARLCLARPRADGRQSLPKSAFPGGAWEREMGHPDNPPGPRPDTAFRPPCFWPPCAQPKVHKCFAARGPIHRSPFLIQALPAPSGWFLPYLISLSQHVRMTYTSHQCNFLRNNNQIVRDHRPSLPIRRRKAGLNPKMRDHAILFTYRKRLFFA